MPSATWYEQSGASTPQQPRSMWRRFVDDFIEGGLHNPMGAEGVVRATSDLSSEELNRRERILSDRYNQQRQFEDETLFKNVDTFSPANIGKHAVDLLGNLIGGADPTYALGPGETAIRRILAQSAINAGQNAASQGLEIHRGVRDEFSPAELALNAGAGAVFQGGVEGAHSFKLGQRVKRGTNMPGWRNVNDVILDLEGGGTFAQPRTSPKGAMGPQQVMPSTARKPGFGIRPWDGKSQADLARVGRQYSAAMMDKYDGDVAKVLAAYNAGPGRVDGLIKKFGDSWHEHLPSETKHYVANGLVKAGVHTGPEDLGDINLVGNELPSPDEMARVNNALTPEDQAGLQDIFDQGNGDGIDYTDFMNKMEEQARLVADSPNVHDITEGFDIREKNAQDAFMSSEGASIKNALGQPRSAEEWDQIGQGLTDPREEVKRATQDYYDGKIGPEEWRDALDKYKEARTADVTQFPVVPRKEALQRYSFSDPEQANLRQAKAEGKVVNLYDEKTKGQRAAYEAEQKAQQDRQTSQLENFLKDIEGVYQQTRRGQKVITRNELADMRQDSHVDSLMRQLKSRDEAGSKLVFHNEDLIREASARLDELDNLMAEMETGNVPPIRNPELKVIQGNPQPRNKFLQTLKDILNDKRGSYRPDWRERRAESDAQRSEEPADETPTGRLKEALSKAEKLNDEQKAMYSEARSERLKKSFARQGGTYGEKGFYAELAALRGSLPKVEFENIRQHLSQHEIDLLHEQLKVSPNLRGFESISAREGLNKLLDGGVPTDSEIRLMGEVFPRDVMQEVIKRRVVDVWEHAANIWNIPKSATSSYDISAAGRQGVFLSGRKEFYSSFVKQFDKITSEKKFNDFQDSLKKRPTYPLMKRAGLALTDVGGFLGDREEAFLSNATKYGAEHIPLYGEGIKASNRAYVAFLNQLRADVFDDLIKKGADLGVDWEKDPKALKSLGAYLNAATGRGNLGKLSHAAPFLNSIFFSPRLMASRLSLLNPFFYAGLHPFVRKEAAKDFAKFSGIANTMLGLAALSGATVVMDPKSSDFGKIKVGDVRLDILGGFQQYMVLEERLRQGATTNISGKTKELGKGYKADTRLSLIERFLRSKFGPSASYVANALAGENIVGEKFNAVPDDLSLKQLTQNDTSKMFLPLFSQDVADAVSEYGPVGLAAVVPAVLGIGVQTFKPRPPKEASGKRSKFYENRKESTSKSWYKE